MKKITITLIGIMAIMFFTGNVYAAAFGSASAGAPLTIGGANSDDLVFTPSPGILLGGATTATAFTIVSGNTKALTDAIVVMMTNTDPRVYQIAQDLSAVTAGSGLTGYGTTAGETDSTFKERN